MSAFGTEIHRQDEPDATVRAAIVSVLQRHPSVTMAILFGSLAAGRGRPDSDLDLAVSTTAPLTVVARVELIDELAAAVGRPIDLIDLTQAHGPLLQQVLTTGRLMLCRNRTEYAELMRRQAYEEADLMPYYRRILATRRQAWIETS
ncbi:MAG TPA: nucleotidyltransferase domain-containing protein [Nitrospira sp.]|nr:nucleotidyltransferase domain-containing protein [Nitrospira sp.]HPV83356.1 nucleotidyltransferase domain-containing protein [Nitrospira sp.]